MCDPISIGIATAALAVGGAVTEHIGTNRLYHANEMAANFDFANQSNIINQKAVQLDQAKSEDAFDTAITSIQTEGQIQASASEQGLGNQSIVQALNAGMFGIGRQASVADLNDVNARSQLANEKVGAEITRSSRVASAPRSGLLNLAIGVGKGVMSGVNAGMGAAKK